MKYLLPAFVFILSMTIGYLHVGVILLTTRILWDPDYIKRSTDLAKSRPDGGVLLCELGSVQVVYHSYEGLEMSIVSLRVLKVRNPTNRL